MFLPTKTGVLPDKGKLYQCSCSPLERSVALVTGDGVCAFYRVTNEGTYKMEKNGKKCPLVHILRSSYTTCNYRYNNFCLFILLPLSSLKSQLSNKPKKQYITNLYSYFHLSLFLGEFRRLPTLAPASAEESYLCHCWLPEDRVVVGTASGNLILLEAGNFAGVLSCSPGNGSKINCIVTHSTGFVCGCDKGK